MKTPGEAEKVVELFGDRDQVQPLGERRIPVWDIPIRLVHWSFVLLLPGLWLTWKTGQMALHRQLGYVMLGLLIFRLYWGFFGSSPAQFVSFVRGPLVVLHYARTLFSKPGAPRLGHNPLGGWSVLILLGLLCAQVSLGLFAQDTDGIESGPLAHHVSFETADAARELHEIGFNLILVFVALHIGAVLFHLAFKRDNLIRPMITGHRAMPASVAPPQFAHPVRVIVGAALGIGGAWWVSLGCPLPVVDS